MDRETVYLPEVLFEFRNVGKSIRVIAIDPLSQTEVTMIAPRGLSTDEIKRVAARKLAYVIAKNRRKAPAKDAKKDTGV